MPEQIPLMVDAATQELRQFASDETIPRGQLLSALQVALTGLVTSDVSGVLASDTILQAIGKLQAQASGKVDKVAGKVLSSNDFTNTERVKLANIADQATKNATDADLRDRSTHTGTQGMETITGLSAALDTRVVKTSDVGAAILPEGTDAERPAPGASGLYVRLSKTSGKPEWFNRAEAAWEPIGDTSQLATQLGVVDAAVQVLNNKIGFKIIYPNGGSALSPANVAVNSRYLEVNPFPGFYVEAVAEIFFNGAWGTAEQFGAQASSVNFAYGAKANHITPSDAIVLQTGLNGLIAPSNLALSPFGTTATVTTPLPCRIKVTKGGII